MNFKKLFFIALQVIFIIVSSSSFIIGLSYMNSCVPAFIVNVWLIVHGFLCVFYSLFVLVICITLPLRLDKCEEDYTFLSRKINQRRSALSMPPIQTNEFNPLEDEDLAVKMKRKQSSDIVSAFFGITYIASLTIGTFLVLTVNSICFDLKCYCIFLLAFSAFSSLFAVVKVYA